MISVVIPNFNSGDRLVKNLPKLLELLKKSKLRYEVMVVDDASTDNSVEVLEKLIKQKYNGRGVIVWPIKLIKKNKNTGFGMTVDRGIRVAKGEIVFVLNLTDLLPESSDYFKIILDHFKDRKGLPAGRQVFSVGAAKKEGEEIHGCGRVYFEKGFFLHGKRSFDSPSTRFRSLRIAQDKRTSKEAIYSAWADGGAEAIRREYYLKIGGFDPLYKFYWEDVDLGWRAWKAGYQIDYEPRAILLHAQEEGPIAKYYSERQRRVMNLRNQFIFTWKNADLKHLELYLFWELFHSLVATKNGDGGFFRAYWQAMVKWPEILMTRMKQKKVTKLTDDQVLRVFQEKSL